MKVPVHFLLASFLVFVCGTAVAESSRTDFEQGFIGRIWTLKSTDVGGHPLSEQCENTGQYVLPPDDQYGVASFRCDDQRSMQVLLKFESSDQAQILDALLLPKLEKGEEFMLSGDCELKGSPAPFFVAIAKLGAREKVSWKTGVRAAWFPNLKTGKIEPLSTRNIVCYRPTPP